MLKPVPWYRLARWLYVHKVPLLPKVIDRLIEFVFHCRLPYTIEIGEGFEVGHYGLGVYIHPRAQIGRNVFICPCVTIGGRSQIYELPRIQDDVYISYGAKIFGDVVVGEGSVIGANAVVIHSVPPRSIVGGVPARIIKQNIEVYDYTGWPKKGAPRPPQRLAGQQKDSEPSVTCVFYMIDSLKFGGSENQMVQLARRLNSGRYRVTVGCLRAEGTYVEELRRAGIPVVEFPLHGGVLRLRNFLQLLWLARFLRRGQFDVVHTHDLWSNLVGVPAAWLARVPIIISSRRDLAHFWWYTPWRRTILRRVQNLGTFVLANSEAVRSFLVKEDGFRADKIRVIRNAVDFERFALARGDRDKLFPGLTHEHKIVILVGNMNILVKGHDVLIEAARTICRMLPETLFILIGDGRQRPQLEQQVQESGLRENFLFLGHRNDVPELLSACDLSVLPSTAEGLPNAVLEAQAAGLPVVASAVGGTPETIENGVTGLLVPPRDPGALAQAILRLLQDAELARRLARAGQESVRTSFSFDRLLRETRELYTEARHRRSGRQEKIQKEKESHWASYPDPAALGLEELELGSTNSPVADSKAKRR